MRDLETAGRAVVAEPAAAPASLESIAARGRRRRRRRSGRLASVAVVVVVGIVASVVAVRASRGATTSWSHRRDVAAITDPQMRAHLGLDVPAGWLPVDYGDARLFVPPTWKITAGGCPGTAPGWIEVGGPYKQICSGPSPANYVAMSAFADDHQPTPVRTVHGYALYRADPGDPNDFVVPALKAAFRAEGPGRDAVLATLAPSSRLIALTYHGVPPRDWSEVAYAGVNVSVPGSWKQGAGSPCGGVPAGHVTLIDAGILPSCGSGGEPDTGPTRDGVRVGRAQPWTVGDQPGQITMSNGNAVLLVQPGDDDRALEVVVRVNAAYGVPIEIGLGVDGRIAATIFASIRVDGSPPGATTTTGAGTDTTTTTIDHARPAASIIGTWQPTAISGYHGFLTKPPLNELPVLTFDTDQTWGGSDACNGYSGTYSLDQGRFRVGRQIIQELMLCRVTVPLRTVLTTATRVDVSGDTLTFLDDRHDVIATYARVKTPAQP